MKGYDYALIAGMICTSGAGMYYQQKYYSLVDKVIVAFVDTEDRYHELASKVIDDRESAE